MMQGNKRYVFGGFAADCCEELFLAYCSGEHVYVFFDFLSEGNEGV